MKKNLSKKNHKTAYSLIELAIVITILSLLITGALSIATSSISKSKKKLTDDRISSIYKALGVYLVTNGHLPCPAPITAIKQSSTDYGVAGNCTATTGIYVSASSANTIYGMVPIQTLGLSKDFAEDSFGSKMAYIVNKNFTTATVINDANTVGATSNTGFGITASSGIITINEILQDGSTNRAITNDAIFAIVSYGVNKSGALGVNTSDITTQNTRSTDSAEMDNDINGAATTSFDNVLVANSLNSEVFDDTVFYKTINDLVSDYDSLSLLKCAAISDLTITYGTTTTNFVWPVSSYNQIASSIIACPTDYQAGVKYPTRRCGPYGIWETNSTNSGVITPCTS